MNPVKSSELSGFTQYRAGEGTIQEPMLISRTQAVEQQMQSKYVKNYNRQIKIKSKDTGAGGEAQKQIIADGHDNYRKNRGLLRNPQREMLLLHFMIGEQNPLSTMHTDIAAVYNKTTGNAQMERPPPKPAN